MVFFIFFSKRKQEAEINNDTVENGVICVGRKRKMTARVLKKKIEEYFDSITSEKPLLRAVPILDENEGKLLPRIDIYGHTQMAYEPVIANNGKAATETVWIRPPSIIDLCLYLEIDRTTFYRWCNPEGEPEGETEEFCNIATRARGRIEAYLTAKTEDKSAARGAIANLEANFGWKRKKEIGIDEQTQRAVVMATMTTEDKLAALREMGISMPFDDYDKGETEDDDESAC